MRRCGVVVVWLVVGSGCGGGGTKPKSDAPVADAVPDAPFAVNDGAHSGTRLKLIRAAFADGPAQVHGLYDAQLASECVLWTWTDGTSRCNPAAQVAEYADSACSQVLAYSDATTSPPAYVIDFDATPCGGYVPMHIYQLGAATTVTTVYYRTSDGNCMSAGAPAAGTTYYAAGADVLDQLATVSIGAPVGSGALTTRYVQSSDGLQLPIALHDTASNLDCLPYVQYGVTSLVCRPPAAWAATDFSDAACTHAELALPTQCPRAAAAATSDGAYHAVGAQIVSPSDYRLSGSSCVSSPTTGNVYFTLGPAVTLPSMTRARDHVAAQRIETIHAIADDTIFTDLPVARGAVYRDPVAWYVSSDALYDTTLATECDLPRYREWGLSCLPRQPADDHFIGGFYADTGCSLDLYPVDATSTIRTPYAIKLIPTSNGSTPEVHQLGADYTGTVYTGTPGNCTPVTGTQFAFISVGPVVPLSSLATATLQTDP